MRQFDFVNAIKYISINPLGWGLVVVHWIVVAFAVLGDRPSDPIGFGVHSTTGLMFYLALVDFPALLLARFIIGVFDSTLSITPFAFVLIVVLATIQWLLVGAGVMKAYQDYRQETPAKGDGAVKLG